MSPYSQHRRVVVTGIGAVSPLGNSAPETWKSAIEGRSGIGTISIYDTTDSPVTIAGEVKNFDVTRPITPIRPRPTEPEVTQAVSGKDAKKMGRFIHFAMGAGTEAYIDSGLDAHRGRLDSTRMGVNIGVGMGGLPEIDDVHDDLIAKGYRRITPFFIPEVIPNMASGNLSILLDFQGPNLCNVTACSSSAHSLGESYHLIKRGDADVMIAGGAEAVVTPLGVGGFAAMRALSTRNAEPTRASRPFDVARDGFVMGEGGAALVLEEYEHAKKRGARIYGEVVGYGLSGDAFHMTLPAPQGAGGYRAMEMAIKNSGVAREKVGYINAHGTSTPAGDTEEAAAVAKLFPNAKSHLHVSSTKSMTGHLLGAAGALEALFALLSVYEDKIPPTINLENIDPKCLALGLDYTANKAVSKKVEYAMSNSFGFGGTNACVMLGKVTQ